MFLDFPDFELAFLLSMHLKHKALCGGYIETDMGYYAGMGAVKPFGNTEQGTERPYTFYRFFAQPFKVGVFLFRSVFSVEIGKICNDFDFFRLETRAGCSLL